MRLNEDRSLRSPPPDAGTRSADHFLGRRSRIAQGLQPPRPTPLRVPHSVSPGAGVPDLPLPGQRFLVLSAPAAPAERCGSSELKTPVSQGVLIPASRT